MAKLLLESMESEWDPNRYHDTHRQKVEDLVEAKKQGNEIVIGSVEVPTTKVADLMEVLSASLASVKSGGDQGERSPAALQDPDREEACRRQESRRRAGSRSAAKSPTSITSKERAKAPSRRKAS